MTLDRSGDDLEPAPPHDPDRCPKWLGEDDDGHPIPCLLCKPHLTRLHRDVDDYADIRPSARAQQAIERENQE